MKIYDGQSVIVSVDTPLNLGDGKYTYTPSATQSWIDGIIPENNASRQEATSHG
jgi:hypothetical protein